MIHHWPEPAGRVVYKATGYKTVRDAKPVLVRALFAQAVREQSLAMQLGVSDGDVWAASKHGGPVHLWRFLAGGSYISCPNAITFPKHAADTIRDRTWFGRVHDPLEAKRVCWACRVHAVGLYLAAQTAKR